MLNIEALRKVQASIADENNYFDMHHWRHCIAGHAFRVKNGPFAVGCCRCPDCFNAQEYLGLKDRSLFFINSDGSMSRQEAIDAIDRLIAKEQPLQPATVDEPELVGRMTTRLAIRGFVEKQLIFQELVTVDEDSLDTFIPELAMKHAEMMSKHELHRIELECLDLPESHPLRVFHFGTNPTGMTFPIAIKLTEEK